MKSQPGVSVVVPAYNSASVIERTLTSIAVQTVPPDEIVVVDDASTDDTVERALSLGLDRLHIERLATNGGPGRARNVGVRVAKHQWIAFLDADDEWQPDLLERALAAADLTKARVVGCGGTRVMTATGGAPRERRFVLRDDGSARDITAVYWRLGIRPLTPAGMLVQRELMLRVGGFPEDMRRSEDTILNARLWLASRIVFVDRILYRSTQGPASLSSRAPTYADTWRVLSRVGAVMVRALARRRPGARDLLRAYPGMIWTRHRRWLNGRLGRPAD